eukprot:Nitzschia sp. Nitz4//scaffold78_size91513//6535//8461//NITZ4_004913-RA/size91513-snap-gene-0.119-mRNA-1//1//CDS//3329558082//5803//frame0
MPSKLNLASIFILWTFLCWLQIGESEVSKEGQSECGVWLALSTLPGAGIGMFAGRDFKDGERFMLAGDHIIPIIDVITHLNYMPFFLWDEYTWNPGPMRAKSLGLDEVNVASAGFGAAANSFMDFVNADEGYPEFSIAHQLHRKKDPGAGAFTYLHSRPTTAISDIHTGQELFVSYGNNWFTSRQRLGPIPINGQHAQAEKLYRKFKDKFLDGCENTTLNCGIRTAALDFWETFVIRSAWNASRTFAALPPPEEYDDMLEMGLKNLKKSKMVRDQEWLREHGACADNMYSNESTIKQAGHGAFASRKLKEGSVVLPIPLIHIPNRSVLEMYKLDRSESKGRAFKGDHSRPHRPQLLLNYCLGHRESSLLLSPYGPVFNLINHNQTLANVRLQWASPKRSQHNPTLLDNDVETLEEVKSAQLAMELVALRDIRPHEEIFLDYGDEWETAWQKHVATWKPDRDASTYVSASEMDARPERLRTEFEQLRHPYPWNLVLKFHKAFTDEEGWKNELNKTDRGSLKTYLMDNFRPGYVDTEILRYKEVNGRIIYTCVIEDFDKKGKWHLIREAPREAFAFEDRPYTSDLFLPNAFRHDIRVPDDIFPERWKNLEKKKSNEA